MDGGLVAVILIVIANIIVSIFSAGRLVQKVNDLAARVTSMEKKVDNTDEHLDRLAEKVAKIQGQLLK